MIYNNEYCADVLSSACCIDKLDLLKNKSIVVTGATGLIGSSLVDLLLLLRNKYSINYRIYCAVRNTDAMKMRFGVFSDMLIPLCYDLEKGFPDDIDFDYIVHCAGIASPEIYTTKPVEMIKSTFNGLSSITEYLKRKNNSKVVYLSSSEVYGSDLWNHPIQESESGYVNILSERSSYSMAKRIAETYLYANHIEYGAKVVFARPGHVFGHNISKHDNRVHALFLRCAANGSDIVLKSDGSSLRSYCYSMDCASALLVLMLSGISGMAYNIAAPSQTISIRDLASLYSEYSNISVKFSIPSETEKSSFNKMNYSVLDGERIKHLGWSPANSLREGVAKSIKYYNLINNSMIN